MDLLWTWLRHYLFIDNTAEGYSYAQWCSDLWCKMAWNIWYSIFKICGSSSKMFCSTSRSFWHVGPSIWNDLLYSLHSNLYKGLRNPVSFIMILTSCPCHSNTFSFMRISCVCLSRAAADSTPTWTGRWSWQHPQPATVVSKIKQLNIYCRLPLLQTWQQNVCPVAVQLHMKL